MEQYISKAALVAEIKGLIRANELYLSEPKTDEIRFQKVGAYSVLNDLLYSIDTLEVKDIELEQETQRILDEHFFYPEEDDELKEIPKLARYIAKHFFELGLNAQKGNEL